MASFCSEQGSSVRLFGLEPVLIIVGALFEVGGKTKDFSQIKDIPNSYLAVADTEIGMGNRIPLWMFGLLY